MKKNELATLWHVITNLEFDAASAKFVYGISKNKAILKPIMQEIDSGKTRSAEYITYDQERVQLCKDMAVKDENDKPIIDREDYKIVDKDLFDLEFNKLKEKYSDMFKEEEKREKDFAEMLEEEVDIKFYKINVDYVPFGIPVKFMDVLLDTIIVDSQVV